MPENPYQPPRAALMHKEAQPNRPKRFRLRIIPAVLCFLYGGVGVLIVLAVLVISVGGALSGMVRIRFDAIAIWVVGYEIPCAMLLVAGWNWHKGKWRRAIILTAASIGLLIVLNWLGPPEPRRLIFPIRAAFGDPGGVGEACGLTPSLCEHAIDRGITQ
jgi:hypothetical protein